MASIVYLDIDQGSDFAVELDIQADDGTPMNLTGFQVYSQFRKSYNSVIGYQFETQVLNGPAGKIKLTLNGVTSSDIRPGRYLYDIEVYSPGNSKTRIVEGIVTINPEITRIP